MSGDTPPMTIRELTGDQRTIRLVTRALPYRPFDLTTKMRVEVDWYPGVGQATAQVLGPTESPTSLNGYWKDKYLGAIQEAVAFQLNNGGVLTAAEAADIADSFVLRGQLLELKWMNTTRRGFWTSFAKKWHTAHDLEWTMEFTWVDRGLDPGPAVFATVNQLGDVSAAMRARMDALDQVLPPRSFGLLNSYVTAVQGFQHSIEDLVNSVEDTVQNFTNQALTSVTATRGIIASLGGIETEAQTMIDFLNQSVAGAMNAVTPVQNQSFADALEAAEFRSELNEWAREMRQEAVEQRTVLGQQISSDLLAVYIAVDGQDLRDVSRIYYGTALEWRRIMLFNDLYSIELDPGDVVYVPKINQAQVGQQLPGN